LQQTPLAQKPLTQSAPVAHFAPFMRRPQLPVSSHCRPLTHWAFDVHLSKQAPVAGLHEDGTQMTVAPGLQRPMPSHECMPITASPSHVPGLHIVPAACFRQPPAPSQVPSCPQSLAAVATQVLSVRGLPPGWMPMQVPADASAVQVMQPSVQAVLQQTPSTQKPLAQSPAQAQGWPVILPLPASQTRASASARSLRTSLSAPLPSTPPSIIAAPPSPLDLPDLQPTATTTRTATPAAKTLNIFTSFPTNPASFSEVPS
jgi:hypothetical protein